MKTFPLRGISLSLSLSLCLSLSLSLSSLGSLSLSLPLTGVTAVAAFLRAAALFGIRDCSAVVLGHCTCRLE